MQIILDLPDWCDERHIYILAGIELAAYKHQGQAWRVKDGRCVQCGDCCTGHKPGHPFMEIAFDGKCMQLVPDGTKILCAKGEYRGLHCSTGDPVKDKWANHKCRITYK